MQKTESSSSTAFQKRNSTHRRQGDLLESIRVSYKTFQALQPQVLTKATPVTPETFQSFRHSRHSSLSNLSRHSSHSRHSRDISDIPVINDLPAFPGNSTNSTSSSISRDSTPVQHSPIRMHILQFDWFPENSTEYQLSNYKHYKHSFFKEREMLRYRSN